MSEDITEACPLFCLLEMVCVFLKDSLKRKRKREGRESDKWFFQGSAVLGFDCRRTSEKIKRAVTS